MKRFWLVWDNDDKQVFGSEIYKTLEDAKKCALRLAEENRQAYVILESHSVATATYKTTLSAMEN